MVKHIPHGFKSATLLSLLFLLPALACIAQGNLYAVTQTNKVSYLNRYKNNFADTSLNNNDVHATAKAGNERVVPWFVEKFKITAGFFIPVNNTNISVNGANGNIGTDIDFEDDLGFNKTTGTFLGDFQWRSSSRSRFDFSYYRLYRNSDYTLQKTINFGDHTYPVSAQVNSYFNTNIYRLSYGYAILSKPTYEAGLLIGAHIVRFGVGIDLLTSIGSGGVKDNFGVTAPLPDFGLWGGWTMGKRWAVNAEADYLTITIDNISGRIVAYNAALTYKAASNLSFAAGYTGLNFKVDVDREKFNGHLRWGYNGPSITATFTFGRKGWSTYNDL